MTTQTLSEVPGIQLEGMLIARDMGLLRAILLDLAATPGLRNYAGTPPERIVAHAAMLVDAGYATGQVLREHGGTAAHVVLTGLTWAGHELAAAIAPAKVWKEVTARITAAGGALAIDAVKALAIKLAATLLDS